MNKKMSAMLQRAGLRWPVLEDTPKRQPPDVEIVEDCVLLKDHWEPNERHVKITDFPDKTGFECFINHVHLPSEGTRESLVSCLKYAATLREALMPFTRDRQFRVVVAIPEDDDCTVRFHQIRPGENWIAEDLEGYKSDAVLVFDIPE